MNGVLAPFVSHSLSPSVSQTGLQYCMLQYRAFQNPLPLRYVHGTPYRGAVGTMQTASLPTQEQCLECWIRSLSMYN